MAQRLSRSVPRICSTSARPGNLPAPAAEREECAPYGLTARELEVLRLLARRLTARGIAETLYISPKTAGYHVGNILAKLGAADRREAALAVRADLV